MRKQIRQFDAQFKQEAVNYYHSSGKTGEQVAKELKIAKSTLSEWLRDASDWDNAAIESFLH